MDATSLLGKPATDIAAAVQAGHVTATDVARVHLERIDALDPELGAFTRVLHDRAMAEAAAVDAHPDRDTLPLAGVPVAIKDNVAVRDVPTGLGTRALSGEHAAEDDLVVTRLVEAGAIVVGVTRCPELCVFGNSDDPAGAARNPWDPTRVTGGSSGGSAAAVSSGMVPIAHASDGMGSIRIPAAATGLVGIKPGPGVVPIDGDLENEHWYGMTSFGPLATTVDDLALALAVFSAREEFAALVEPTAPLRVALSTAPPAPGIIVGKQQRLAVTRLGEALAAAGHTVTTVDPPYDLQVIPDLLTRWTNGTADDIDALGADSSRLQRRTRTHAAIGRVLRRVRPVRERQAERWKSKMDGFLADFDLLLTPVMASAPPRGHGNWERGWLHNFVQGLRWVPWANAFNLAQLPAAAVPAGLDDLRMPLSVQVVAPRGQDAQLLAALRLIERIAPWPRHPA